METSALPEKTMTVSKEEINHSHTAIKGKNVGIALLYSTDIKTIKVRYGISFIDESKQKPTYSGK